MDEPVPLVLKGRSFLCGEALVSSGDLGRSGVRSAALLPVPTDGPPAAAGPRGKPEAQSEG